MPGTVTELRSVRGMVSPVMPLSRASCKERRLGDFPEPFIAFISFELASKNRQNASLWRAEEGAVSQRRTDPPMPQQLGSVMLRAAEVATAASQAFPPR